MATAIDILAPTDERTEAGVGPIVSLRRKRHFVLFVDVVGMTEGAKLKVYLQDEAKQNDSDPDSLVDVRGLSQEIITTGPYRLEIGNLVGTHCAARWEIEGEEAEVNFGIKLGYNPI